MSRKWHPSQSRENAAGIWLVPALLIATLFQNYYDLSAILDGEKLALYAYEGPLIFKLGKDAIYITLLAVVARRAFKFQQSPMTDYALMTFCIIAMLFVFSALVNGPIVALLGIRWSLPFLLFFILRDWARAIERKQAIRWLMAGMITCLAAQIYQLFNMPPVFGEVLPGIPARTPGIFIAPNSTAFFACASAAFILALSGGLGKFSAVCIALAIIISLLAQSGTGMIVSFILGFRALTSKRPAIFWTISLLIVLATVPNLDSLTQRDDYVSASGGGRLKVLADITQKSALEIHNFGVFTNAANLQSDNPKDQVAADSLVASWIGNFGGAAPLLFALTCLFITFNMRKVNWKIAAPCAITFAFFSMTTIVFEAFPMNIFVAIGLWVSQTPRSQANRPRQNQSIS